MSEYFLDGRQTLQDILKESKELGFEGELEEKLNIVKLHENLSPSKRSKTNLETVKKLTVAEIKDHNARKAEDFLSKYIGQCVDENDVKILTPKIANIMYFQRNASKLNKVSLYCILTFLRYDSLINFVLFLIAGRKQRHNMITKKIMKQLACRMHTK